MAEKTNTSPFDEDQTEKHRGRTLFRYQLPLSVVQKNP